MMRECGFRLLPIVVMAASVVVRMEGADAAGFTYRTAIGPEQGVVRRDPSDVIAVNGVYFV